MSLPGALRFSGRRELPVMLAGEAAECGLACIAMIASFHGHNVDLNGLRQRHSISMAGATLRGLMDLAERLDLSGRPVKLELSGLKRLKLPAIAHWEMRHFVVIAKVTPQGAVIHDPSRGARFVPMAELAKSFTGIALELTPSAEFARVTAKASVPLNALWSRIAGFWPAAGQVLVLSLGMQAIVFILPFQMQLVVDQAIQGADLNLLLVIALGFAGLVVMQGLIEMLRAWALQVFGHQMTFQIMGNLVRHLVRLPADYFEKRHVGDLISRLGSAKHIQEVLTQGLVAALIDGTMSLVAVIILFVYSWELAAVVIVGVILHVVAVQIVFPMMRKRQEEELVEGAKEQTHLMETVRAATTIKLMGRESSREGNWRNLYANVINASISSGKWSIGLNFWQSVVGGLQVVLIIYLGARMVIAAEGFSVGMLFAFMSFRQTFNDRFIALIEQSVQFRFLKLHLDRIADIVTTEKDAVEDGEAVHAPVRGDIRFDKVSFRYGETDPFVLNMLDLHVRPGEFVAITGKSGGGKSTLVKLMLGLQKPTSGAIVLDGQQATPGRWRSWRESVGVVMQDDRLMSGTIAENIAFFDPDMDLDAVRAAATAAQIDTEIEQMPMRYLSLVGDMGSALSGGQKQRVLLARALYRKPSILVLDEGTANLDVLTEETIAEVVANMPITRIIVAHRPALVRRADRVLGMGRDGLVVERDRLSPAVHAVG